MKPKLRAATVTMMSAGMSALLAVLMFTLYMHSDSQLVLAQAADSAIDVITAIVLGFAVRVALQPADEGHPHGHRAAEPIAALVLAVLAGVTGVEVLRTAVDALVSSTTPRFFPILAVAMAAKLVGRGCIWVSCTHVRAREPSPALAALQIDARNDILGTLLALIGFAAAKFGWSSLDAWFAMPVGIWICYSGFELARENIDMLMGAAATATRHAQLTEMLAKHADVHGVPRLVARYHGTHLDVVAEVVADPSLTLRDAQSLRSRLEDVLMAQADVERVNVHISCMPPTSAEASQNI